MSISAHPLQNAYIPVRSKIASTATLLRSLLCGEVVGGQLRTWRGCQRPVLYSRPELGCAGPPTPLHLEKNRASPLRGQVCRQAAVVSSCCPAVAFRTPTARPRRDQGLPHTMYVLGERFENDPLNWPIAVTRPLKAQPATSLLNATGRRRRCWRRFGG